MGVDRSADVVSDPSTLELVIRADVGEAGDDDRRIELRFKDSLGRLYWAASRAGHEQELPGHAAVFPCTPVRHARVFLAPSFSDDHAFLRVCIFGDRKTVVTLIISPTTR